ncbi:hypothetical protein BJ170DRAFT_461492 [Xylariales sp. AK1849]|nr:hypothetical protein BJ170DRAFT_461492 [Xylariales sp. AK1849]
MVRSTLPALAYIALCNAANLTTLPDLLKSISSSVFQGVKGVSVDIYNHPEISKSEFYAHDAVVTYFTETQPDLWKVTPHAYGEPTSWTLEFTNIPDGVTGSEDDVPAVGFLAEYDALIGIGHACGHHLITLNGLAAASIARQALIDLNIPGRIKLVGCPDEENTAGKNRLEVAGAFNGIDVWMMAHPTLANAVQPMQSRQNVVADFSGETHAETVKKAYGALVEIIDLAESLPGNSSTASPVEDVGMFASNVVQQQIKLGIAGLTLKQVQETVNEIFDDTYVGVNYTAQETTDVGGGVALVIDGPGGHASESLKTPLRLSIETFRTLTSDDAGDVSFFLPGNVTVTQLDITVSVRTRYSLDQQSVTDTVKAAIEDSASKITTDLPYPALEVDPVIGNKFVSLMKTDDYGETDWAISTIAPAATDASFVQGAELDPVTRELLSVERVLLHSNFAICSDSEDCPFPHEPLFKEAAGQDLAFDRTEVVARALAQIAVEVVADKSLMDQVTALVRN